MRQKNRPSVWASFLAFGVLLPNLVFGSAGTERTLLATAAFVGEGQETARVSPAGNIDCFDYYRFGSVTADLTPESLLAAPGTSLHFSGELKNANAYPVLDLTVYAKVFRKDLGNSGVSMNGHALVDQFVAAEDITLGAGAAKPLSFEWAVPEGAEKDEYRLATYVISGDRYNLSGLSFTDDVTGTSADFSVGGTVTKSVYWGKNEVTMNGQPYYFAGFIPVFEKETPVKIEMPLVNGTSEAADIEVVWKTYRWDGQRESELVETRTEMQRFAPGETKRLAIEPSAAAGAVTYVVAEAKSRGNRSFLDMRFARSGVPQARINFPALASFPAKAGQPMEAFSCFHAVGDAAFPDAVLTLEVTDSEGNSVAQHAYRGSIGSAMMGERFSFTPERDYDVLTLRTALSLAGKTVEEYTVTYDCQAIDPSQCSTVGGANVAESSFGTLKKTGIAIALVLFLMAIIAIAAKRYQTSRRLPTSLSVFLLVLSGVLSLSAWSPTASAKSVSWTSSPYSVAFYDGIAKCVSSNPTNCNLEPEWASIYPPGPVSAFFDYDWGPTMHLLGTVATIAYQANVVNAATNAPYSDGATVPVGTAIKFVPVPFQDSDISWFGTGGYNDSPYGQWDITGPTLGSYVGTTGSAGSCIGQIQMYSSLQVARPAVTIQHTGTAPLSCDGTGMNCTVAGPGSIVSTITYAATTGQQYGAFNKSGNTCNSPSQNIWYRPGTTVIPYVGQDPAKLTATSCSAPAGEATAIACGNQANANKFVLNVPTQNITFNLMAGSASPAGWCLTDEQTVSAASCTDPSLLGVPPPATPLPSNCSLGNKTYRCDDDQPGLDVRSEWTCQASCGTSPPTINVHF